MGRTITRVELGRKQVLKTPARKIVEALEGATVTSIERWGKNIVIRATRRAAEANSSAGDRDSSAADAAPVWWLIHLGMSGRLSVEPASSERLKHTHGVFALDRGERELRFVDPRMFGRIEVWRKLPPRLAVLGPEPLEISATDFVAGLRRRRAGLKSLLLNQGFVRGVGNIYADESLYRAGLHPGSPGSRLTAARAGDLHRALQDVLKAAIESKGSSVRTFLYGAGESGGYQNDHQVYGRGGESCVKCGRTIRNAVFAGRTTAWCPNCQKKR